MQVGWSIAYWIVFVMMVLATGLNVWTWRKQRKQIKKFQKLNAEYDVEFDRSKFIDRYFVVQLGSGYIERIQSADLFAKSHSGWDVTKSIISAKKFTSLKEARKLANESGGQVLAYVALGSPAFKEADHAQTGRNGRK